MGQSTILETLGRAFTGSLIGMALVDLDGRWAEVNPALCRMLGRQPAELLGRPLREVTHPDDVRDSYRFREMVASGAPSAFEKRYLHADGSVVWVRVTSSIVEDERGAPQAIFSQVEDITQRRQNERRVSEAEQRFRSAFDHASVGMALVSVDGHLLRANAALHEMLGYDEAAMQGGRLALIVHPDDMREGVRLAAGVMRGSASRYTHEARITRADGEVLVTRTTGSVVRDADGRPQHLVLQVEDITAARRAEADAHLRLAQQTAVAWLGQRALAEPDLDALLEAATAVAAATLGVPLGAFMRLEADGDQVQPVTMIGWDVAWRPFSLAETGGVAAAVFSGSRPIVVEDVRTETRFSTAGLEEHGVASCVCTPVAGEGEDAYGAIGVFSPEPRAFSTDDIAFLTSVANVITGAMRRDAAARRLRHQSLHDPLTRLPNRTLLLDRLRHGMARARRDGSTLAVLFCDIDDFKYVNDSLGHDAGDRLLTALAVRLQEALRSADTLARFGGDEFVVLCEGLREPGEAVHVADRLMEICRDPVDLGAIEYVPTASVGIAIAPPDAEPDPEGLLRDADVAMYGAKARGKGRYEIFDSRMRARTLERITLTGDLRRAIAASELELHYQPIVSLPRREVSGLEALVRWRHPSRGLLMPGSFIGLAEDNGLIHELGRWVVEEAIRRAAGWRRAATPVLDRVLVGVNVSWRQLAQGTLVEDVERALREHDLDASAFCVEVTETALMEEPDRARAALAQLRDMGVHLGLDDFGTGHSSLSVLRDFDLDVIKLDRSFLAGAGEWEIIRAVREMARSLDLLVVAEGIEQADQAERVEAIGCDFGQGWLYCRPAAAEVLPAEVASLAAALRRRGAGPAA